MGLFFCTFPRFLRRGSSGHFLGCVFRSRLSCPDSALTLAWSRELVASSACSSPSPPSCVSRHCRAHLAVLEASRPLGLCLLCGALTEAAQVGVTAPGLRLAALRGGRGAIRCLEGGQMLRGYLKLGSLRAGCRRCFTFQARSCSLVRDLSGGGACWQGWGPAGSPRLLLGPCSLHFQAPPVLLLLLSGARPFLCSLGPKMQYLHI